MLFVAKLGILCIQQELYKSKSNLIPFKKLKSKLLFKRFVQFVSCQLFQEIFIKSKSVVSWRLSFQGNGVTKTGLTKVQSSYLNFPWYL